MTITHLTSKHKYGKRLDQCSIFLCLVHVHRQNSLSINNFISTAVGGSTLKNVEFYFEKNF